MFEVNKKPRKVAVYIRVSTSEQEIDGYGLEAQKKRLLSYINDNKHLNLVTQEDWLFKDTHTGSDLNRPELNRLRKAISENKFDAVMVWKIDRLSRSLRHLLMLFEEFKEKDTSFISVQENIDFKGPIGNLIFQIFGAIAQFERELIKGRTQMGKIASAEMGNYTGTDIPYGYKKVKNVDGKGKKLVLYEKEQIWVRKIYEWYIFSRYGFDKICKELNRLKAPREGRRGGIAWTEKMVRKIICRPIYRGIHVANRNDENGKLLPPEKWTITRIQPSVDEFTFQQAQIVKDNKTGGRVNRKYLLSGKLKDITTGKAISFTGVERNKGGFSYRRKPFTDNNGVKHNVFEIPAKPLEEYVWSQVTSAIKTPELFIKNYLERRRIDRTKKSDIQDKIENLRLVKEKLKLSLDRAQTAYEKGNYSEEVMMDRTQRIEQEINETELEIQNVSKVLFDQSQIELEVSKLKHASEQFKYKIDSFDQDSRKILVSLFVDRIEVKRTDIDGEMIRTANLYLKFNPSEYLKSENEGCSEKALEEKNKPSKVSQKDQHGARERT